MAFLLHHWLTEAAERDPDHEALRCQGRSMSYGDLERASNGVAEALIEAGVKPRDRVGISLLKRLELMVGVYGIQKAGACYVPMDPTAPGQRMAAVGDDAELTVLISTPSRAAEILHSMQKQPTGPTMLVDEFDEADLPGSTMSFAEAASRAADAPPSIRSLERDLACIMYTSGSTGLPKGVPQSHRNVLAQSRWWGSYIGATADFRFLNSTPLHFAPSLLMVHTALWSGGTLVLVPEEVTFFGATIRDLLKEERISAWIAVPAMVIPMMQTLSEPGELPDFRILMWGGAVFPTKQVRELRRLLPDTTLLQVSGSTESLIRTVYRVDELPPDDQPIPVGQAIDNAEVFVLREDGTPAGPGEEGEMFVRGALVFPGYWHDFELTSKVLVQNPLHNDFPDPVYRTGDIGRLLDNGDLVFVGRLDHMVKVRGYRIELGDIEAAITLHPAVTEAVAVAVPHDEWQNAVLARIIPEEGQHITEKDVKRHLGERLPKYMIPVRIEVVDQLPRTASGKVDRVSVAEEMKAIAIDVGDEAPLA